VGKKERSRCGDIVRKGALEGVSEWIGSEGKGVGVPRIRRKGQGDRFSVKRVKRKSSKHNVLLLRRLKCHLKRARYPGKRRSGSALYQCWKKARDRTEKGSLKNRS